MAPEDCCGWKEIKQVYNTAKENVSKAIDYVKENGVVEVTTKATVGISAGIKTPFGKVGAGVLDTEIGHATISTNANDEGKHAEVETGDGKNHNYAEIGVKLGDKKLGVSGKADYVLDKMPDGGDLIDDYKGGKVELSGNLGSKNVNNGTNIKVNTNLSAKKDFKGLEIGFGAKLILGYSVKIKIGIEK